MSAMGRKRTSCLVAARTLFRWVCGWLQADARPFGRGQPSEHSRNSGRQVGCHGPGGAYGGRTHAAPWSTARGAARNHVQCTGIRMS